MRINDTMKTNKLLKIYLFTVAVLAMNNGAAAEQLDCKNASTTLEIDRCAYQDYENQESKLDALIEEYLTVLKQIKTADTQGRDIARSFDEAQNYWLQYRDKNCQFYYDLAFPGSAASHESTICMRRMTRERAKEIHDQIEFWKSR